jgi:hypothetical protein
MDVSLAKIAPVNDDIYPAGTWWGKRKKLGEKDSAPIFV